MPKGSIRNAGTSATSTQRKYAAAEKIVRRKVGNKMNENRQKSYIASGNKKAAKSR